MLRGETAEARSTLIQGIENSGKSFYRFHAELHLYEGNYVSAAQQIEFATEQEFNDLQESDGEAFLVKAKIYRHAGLADLARDNFNHAKAYFEAELEKNPESYFIYSKLGLAHAGLGNKQQALEYGQKVFKLASQNYSAVNFPFILYDMAVTYTLCDDKESALNTLKELMATHSLYTLEFIKIDPDLKPLLTEPGFKDLNP